MNLVQRVAAIEVAFHKSSWRSVLGSGGKRVFRDGPPGGEVFVVNWFPVVVAYRKDGGALLFKPLEGGM